VEKIMLLIDTYLDKSKIQGVGVFSKEKIKKGHKVQEERSNFQIEFDKNNLPSMPLAFANFLKTHCYPKYLHPDILILQFDNSKYINHSQNPNLDHDGFAIEDINIGDEITIDYKEFGDNISAWLT
jgi:SET domain-containing protein